MGSSELRFSHFLHNNDYYGCISETGSRASFRIMGRVNMIGGGGGGVEFPGAAAAGKFWNFNFLSLWILYQPY